MKSKTLTWIIAITLFAALAIPVRLAAQDNQDHNHHKRARYTVKVLGTLGGTFSQDTGLNNRGSVAGFSSLPGDQTVHAFLWRNGMFTDLGTVGGPNSRTSEAPVLNDSGVVSGYSDTSTPDPNGEDVCSDGTHLICLPFVWQKGMMTALPLLGGNNGYPGGINNRGQIVGTSETPNPDPTCSLLFQQIEAVVWQHGHVVELPPLPGDPDGTATAINDNGQAVGGTGCATGNIHAVLWQNGRAIDLGNLGGATGNVGFDINNRGQVVGQSDLPGDTTHHAFLWTKDDGMQDLGTLHGLPVSLANAINDEGQVVGFSQDLNSNNTVASLWQDGVLTDLNTLIPPNSPLFLIEALGINDHGQIAGYGLLSNGEVHGYLLTPCDENHGADEGCEDNAAGTAAGAGVNPVLGAQGPTTASMSNAAPGAIDLMMPPFGRRFRSLYRGHELGRQTQNEGNQNAECSPVLDPSVSADETPAKSQAALVPLGVGKCHVNVHGLLDGWCVGFNGGRCTYRFDNFPFCPRGNRPIFPGSSSCGGKIDYVRACPL